MISIPLLHVHSDANGHPPWYWCCPRWHHKSLEWTVEYGDTFLHSGCGNIDECTVDPEKARAAAEKHLQSFPVWGANRKLDLDVYSLARNIRSENGTGSEEERAAIAFCAINRMKWKGYTSITDEVVHQTRRTYGNQIGGVRPVATSKEASVSDALLADLILKGAADGSIADETRGATVYFGPRDQEGMHVKKPETYPNGVPEQYASFVDGGDYLTWSGHVVGVRPRNLFLMGPRTDLRINEGDSPAVQHEKLATRSLIRKAGLEAAMGTNNPPLFQWDNCAISGAAALERVTSAAGQAIVATLGDAAEDAEDAAADSNALLVIGASAAIAITTGIAIGLLQNRR